MVFLKKKHIFFFPFSENEFMVGEQWSGLRALTAHSIIQG